MKASGNILVWRLRQAARREANTRGGVMNEGTTRKWGDDTR